MRASLPVKQTCLALGSGGCPGWPLRQNLVQGEKISCTGCWPFCACPCWPGWPAGACPGSAAGGAAGRRPVPAAELQPGALAWVPASSAWAPELRHLAAAQRLAAPTTRAPAAARLRITQRLGKSHGRGGNSSGHPGRRPRSGRRGPIGHAIIPRSVPLQIEVRRLAYQLPACAGTQRRTRPPCVVLRRRIRQQRDTATRREPSR